MVKGALFCDHETVAERLACNLATFFYHCYQLKFAMLFHKCVNPVLTYLFQTTIDHEGCCISFR